MMCATQAHATDAANASPRARALVWIARGDAEQTPVSAGLNRGDAVVVASNAAASLRFDDLQPDEGPNDVDVFCAPNGHCVLDALRGHPHLLAAHRTAIAAASFRPADVVLTDRLHGVLLAALVGRPVVALDTLNRKVSRFLDTWLLPPGLPKNAPLRSCLRLATDSTAALEAALEMLPA